MPNAHLADLLAERESQELCRGLERESRRTARRAGALSSKPRRSSRRRRRPRCPAAAAAWLGDRRVDDVEMTRDELGAALAHLILQAANVLFEQVAVPLEPQKAAHAYL